MEDHVDGAQYSHGRLTSAEAWSLGGLGHDGDRGWIFAEGSTTPLGVPLLVLKNLRIANGTTVSGATLDRIILHQTAAARRRR